MSVVLHMAAVFSGFTDLIGEKDIFDIIKSALGEFYKHSGSGKTSDTRYYNIWKLETITAAQTEFFLPLFLEQRAATLLWTDQSSILPAVTSLYTSTAPAHYTSHRGNVFFGKQQRFFQRYGSPFWRFDSRHRRRQHRTQRKFHKTLGRVEQYTSTDTKKIWRKKNCRACPSKCNYWPKFKQ